MTRPLRPLKPDQITTHWLDGEDGSPGCWSQHTGCVDVYVARLKAERDALQAELDDLRPKYQMLAAEVDAHDQESFVRRYPNPLTVSISANYVVPAGEGRSGE